MKEPVRVLFVGAGGVLRSATAMHLMSRLFGYNTRACGIEEDALVPITLKLIKWADEVVAIDNFQHLYVQTLCDDNDIRKVVKSLSIPDHYKYMDPELCALIQRRYFSS